MIVAVALVITAVVALLIWLGHLVDVHTNKQLDEAKKHVDMPKTGVFHNSAPTW